MTYNAVIIDDERDAIELLKHYLEQLFPQINLLGTAQYPDEIMPVLSSNPPELLFLDIKLKGVTGFEILNKLNLPEHVFVIFVTAYEGYALEAFDHEASGYLVKPVTPNKFKATVQKSLDQIDALNALKGVQKNILQKFAIPQNKNFKLTQIDQIIFCQSDGSYTLFYLTGIKKIIASKPLAEIERNLQSAGFIRVHQSYLVNKKHILEFDATNNVLTLSNKAEIPVSRRQKKAIKTLFKEGFLG